MEKIKKGVKIPACIKVIIATVILGLSSVLLMYIMYSRNYYASGCDIWGHLFKSDYMYQNLKEGNLYPMYTSLWYNGLQPYRYWAPLPYYFTAFLQWIGGGSIINAYYLFTGCSMFFGGFAWIMWGKSIHRIKLGTFLGLLWFFLPENVRVFFCEGNLPRMMTTILIPYLVYFIWLYLRKEKKAAMLGIIFFMGLNVLCHVMISAMIGIATFLFLVFYTFRNKTYRQSVSVLAGMLLGFALCGIWLVPALRGGLVGMDSEASASVMKSLSYSLTTSLNPINRLSGIIDTFYYGISIILISLIGLLLTKRKDHAGYLLAIAIVLMTTSAAIPFLSKIPLSQLLWMMRFATIAYAFFLWTFLEWTYIRKYFCLLLCVILLLDCIPSFHLSRYYTQMSGRTNDEIQIAKEITKQRATILDLSAYGSYPSWELCTGDNKINYSFGWAWQGASTAPNIVTLNTALEAENYVYLFDRCVELGNDTVLIRKDLLGKKGVTEAEMVESAGKAGYQLYRETNDTYIFHMDTPNQFGVKTSYTGYSIGKYSSQVELYFPAFTGGKSYYLDDYTVEELSKYKVLYLTGVEFHNRETAEQMVKDLSARGVRVVIDMAHIPNDRTMNRRHFLGAVSQDISFEKRLPTLYYGTQTISPNEFSDENQVWNTSYITGVSKKLGYSNYTNQEMIWLGQNEDSNIYFLAFNLLFQGVDMQDYKVLNLMSEVLQAGLKELPKREIVPIHVTYSNQGMTIDSESTEINTTIAYQDVFVSDNNIKNDNNFLMTNDKHTEIYYSYPMKNAGILVSAFGFFGSILLMILIFVKRRKKEV